MTQAALGLLFFLILALVARRCVMEKKSSESTPALAWTPIIATLMICTAFAGRLGTLSPALTAATMVASVCLVWWWSHRYWSRAPRHSERDRSTAALFIGMIALGYVISSVTSSSSLQEFLTSIPTLIAPLLIAHLMKRPGAVKGLIRGFSAAGGAAILLTLLLDPIYPSLFRGGTLADSLSHVNERLTGPLSHPNALGSMSALVAAAALTYFRGWRRILLFLLGVFGVASSDQRSAWIAILVALLFFGTVIARRWSAAIVVASLVVISAVAVFFQDLVEYAVAALNRRSASVEAREVVYSFVVSHLDDFLPFGVSPLHFHQATGALQGGIGFAHPHNLWLTYLVCGGLIALVGGCALTVLTLWKLVGRNGGAQARPLVAAVLALSVFEAPSFAGTNWLILPVSVFASLALVAAWDAPDQQFDARSTS